MKTPKQWLEEMKLRPCVTENDLLVIIKRIQDDATEEKTDMSWLNQALDEGKGIYKP